MNTPVTILAIPREEMIIPLDVHSKVVLVVDVVRATSTVVSALANGAKAVVPVATVEEAYNLKNNLSTDSEKIILAGERDGFIIPGFDLGNSPQKFISDIITNKIVILKTTNGTPLIKKFSGARILIALSFLNMNAVLHYVLTIIRKESLNEILILEAGDENRISPPDHLCATLFLSCLINQYKSCKVKENIVKNTLLTSYHGIDLISKGLSEDIIFASRVGKYQIVPVLDSKTNFFVKLRELIS